MRETKAYDTKRRPHLESVLSRLSKCVMIVDRNLRHIGCDIEGLNILGLSSVAEMPPGAPESCIAPDHRQIFRDALARAFDAHSGDRLMPIEVQLQRPDGRAIAVECNMARLTNPAGEIDSVLISFQDIVVLETAEGKLGQADSILKSILKTVPDAMVVIDEAGVVTSFSATA